MNDPPTGTVTFLFTDIEGSTKLWEDYPARMPEVLERHDEILRSAVEHHDGYVFKTVGDAFCAAFFYPRKALRAALDAQRVLFAERWGKPIRNLRVRMALHTGYAELERDGDYFGPAVNRVARLISLAYGGQVLLSGTTHDQVCDHPEMVDEQARLVELGEHRLKDLSRPERVCQLVVPGLLERFSPPLRIDEAPEEVEERYRIKHFLGSGGFAKVYLAHDEELDQDVAYKVLHPWHVHDEEFVERFKREARNAAKLRSHPNVVPVYDRGVKEDGTYYMVMEYLPGGSLEDLLVKEGPLPVRRALGITLQIAQALSEAHQQGVIHRDIKPENVLMTKWGDAKVTDFGIAKAAEAATRLTRTGLNLGTVHYISPEQVSGEEATFRSDLYALGVVLYKMLAGKLPFDGETTQEIQIKHLHERACPLKEMNPNVEVPERVEAVTMRLLAKDPNERYPDAAALIEELERPLRSLEEDEHRRRVVEEAAIANAATNEEDAAFAENVRSEARAPSIVIEVPDLTGQDVLLASETLSGSSLTLGAQEEVPSETVPEGEIIGQSPEAGTEVEAGSLVSVTVSSGPSTIVEVPDISGLNRSEAKSALTEVGLKIGMQAKVSSGTVPEARIIKQRPVSGTKAKRGSSVSITASSGKVGVPDLVGQKLPQARRKLAEVGLKLGDKNKAPNDTVSKGSIIKQEPAARTKAKRGSSVSITVSSGPQQEAVTADVRPERQDRRKRKELLGAVAAVFAGVAWIAWGILASANLSSPAVPGDITALIGTLGGLVGIHTRQATSYGRLGLAGFLATFVGIGSLLVIIMLVIPNVSPEASGLFAVSVLLGVLSIPIGFMLLGVATLRSRVLPRWCGVALIIAACCCVAVFWSPVLSLVGKTVLGLAWLALGYALWPQRDVSAEQPDV